MAGYVLRIGVDWYWGTAQMRLWAVMVVCAWTSATARGDPRPAAGIQDNSFLIEEAYNQEAGVVQHISNLRSQGGERFFNFTQEWPVFRQRHQFSYAVPYAWTRPGNGGQQAPSDPMPDLGAGGPTEQGVGDIMLNYRWQALFERKDQPAFAPRLSLILPTGDRDKELGNESFGYQINMPVSKIIADRVTMHANAGLTSYFDIDDRQPTSFNLGGSVIYAINRDFNLMFETLGEWNESVDAGEVVQDFTFTVSPGVRYAFNFSDAQLVVGLAAPWSFAAGAQAFEVFLYLSYEHQIAH